MIIVLRMYAYLVIKIILLGLFQHEYSFLYSLDNEFRRIFFLRKLSNVSIFRQYIIQEYTLLPIMFSHGIVLEILFLTFMTFVLVCRSIGKRSHADMPLSGGSYPVPGWSA